MLGVVEFPLGAHFGQEASGVVAGGLGVGEGCGQGGPSGIGEDPVGVVGEGRAEVLLEAAGGVGSWGAAGQVRQDGCGGLLVARLEVAEGFLGRCGLLFVAALLVPLGGGAGQVHGGEEQGDGESPPLEGLDLDSRRLVQEAVEAFYETRDARDRLHHAVVAVADHIKAHPDSSRAIHEQCLRLMGDERDARVLSGDIEDGGHY